jgi:hypothetical protein
MMPRDRNAHSRSDSRRPVFVLLLAIDTIVQTKYNERDKINICPRGLCPSVNSPSSDLAAKGDVTVRHEDFQVRSRTLQVVHYLRLNDLK